MKLALITGASSGIGAATSRLFAENDIAVLLVGRRSSELIKNVEAIGSLATPFVCDLGNARAVQDMAHTIVQQHGVPDVIINSAGGGAWKTLQATDVTEISSMVEAPFLSSLYVTKAFLPYLLRRDRGVIIHIGSPAAYIAWPSSVGYTATRAALRGLHEGLLQDLTNTGVRSCHVIFGKVDTPYFKVNQIAASKIPWVTKLTPTLSPETCAKWILQVSRHPKPLTVLPFLVRISIAFSSLFPNMMRWIARL